jgi:hypothetical protein
VEIKFRKKDLVKTIRRIDPVCKKLVGQLGKWVPHSPPPGPTGSTPKPHRLHPQAPQLHPQVTQTSPSDHTGSTPKSHMCHAQVT